MATGVRSGVQNLDIGSFVKLDVFVYIASWPVARQEPLGGISPEYKTCVKLMVLKKVGVILLEYDQPCCKKRSLDVIKTGAIDWWA